MRMWMVDPKIMCRKHLLGEHVEHHMFAGTIKKGISLAGYLQDNLMEPARLDARHTELVKEMEARGYNHQSPFFVDYGLLTEAQLSVKIDREAALTELLRRCPECRERHEELENAKA